MFRFDGKPAPGDLVAVHDFLNTWSEELGIEDLATPEAADAWLRDAGLLSSTRALSAKDVTHLQAFRSNLRQFILDPAAGDALADDLERVALELTLADGKLQLRAVGSGATEVIGNLLRIAYAAMADGTWQRLGCCRLPSCGWAFYDHTRSRTKRWCSMQTCGSRSKARAFYQRKKDRDGNV